jgi:adenosylmethionine-8-amino-7-oxononanoate aminotransferase
MQGLEFVKDQASKEPLPDEANVGGRISAHAQARGLIVRPLGHMAVLSPPLILGASEIDFVANVLRESIVASMDDLKGEGFL